MSTHTKPFSVSEKKITLNYSKSSAMGFFSMGLKDDLETAVVNEPSVFEPLKFYCKSRKLRCSHSMYLLSKSQTYFLLYLSVSLSAISDNGML